MRGVALLALAALVGTVVSAASCSDEGSAFPVIPEGGPQNLTPVCEPDTTTHCSGDAGCLGDKVCGPDGTYGECVCIVDSGARAMHRDSGVMTPSSDGASDAARDAIPDAPLEPQPEPQTG
jgi:hypothetical protein